MGKCDNYPDFGFDFEKISAYWRSGLSNAHQAQTYLRVIARRLDYWLSEQGVWIHFEVAATHLAAHLHLDNINSRLAWLALRRRVRTANYLNDHVESRIDRKSRPHGEGAPEAAGGKDEAVWHEDFRGFYQQALRRERDELRRLVETGLYPENSGYSTSLGRDPERRQITQRPRLQWLWANRLLAYLFEALRETGAIDGVGAMWAALDGVFVDRAGRPITRKDLSLWAHQYHNNIASGAVPGKPKRHEKIDAIVSRIGGK